MPPLSRQSLSDQVYLSLRTALLDGQYEPGERLRVADIAARMGTSSTPVREAIQRLASEHAVEVTNATAIRVPTLDPAQLDEILSMRILLEGRAAELAARHVTPAELDELSRIQHEYARVAPVDSRMGSLRNREFHFALMRAARQPLLQRTVESLWVMMGPLVNEFHARTDPGYFISPEHNHFRILRALAARDAEAAGQAMRNDLENARVMVTWAQERMAG